MRDLRGRGRPRWYVKEEAELLFLIQLDTVVRETQNVRVRPRRLLRSRSGVQNLLATSLWIFVGRRVLAALTTAGVAAIELFPIGCMTIAYESIALTVGTV